MTSLIARESLLGCFPFGWKGSRLCIGTSLLCCCCWPMSPLLGYYLIGNKKRLKTIYKTDERLAVPITITEIFCNCIFWPLNLLDQYSFLKLMKKEDSLIFEWDLEAYKDHLNFPQLTYESDKVYLFGTKSSRRNEFFRKLLISIDTNNNDNSNFNNYNDNHNINNNSTDIFQPVIANEQLEDPDSPEETPFDETLPDQERPILQQQQVEEVNNNVVSVITDNNNSNTSKISNDNNGFFWFLPKSCQPFLSRVNNKISKDDNSTVIVNRIPFDKFIPSNNTATETKKQNQTYVRRPLC
jgi:hypothetical protein